MSYAATLSDIAEAIGAQHLGENVEVAQLSTDTRKIADGDLFLALRGDNFDGQAFCAQAVAKGAIALVVEQPQALGVPQLVVADTRLALGEIAKFNRAQYRGPLIAVTGSNGKTTTKELIASILDVRGPSLATQGNLNNDIGVPLTLLRLDGSQGLAVVEMGANARGEIAYSVALAQPDVAIITNAMAAHLEGFGSLQGVVEAKGEIFDGLGAEGTAVINLDDPHCQYWLARNRARKIMGFSLESDTADVYASEIEAQASGCYSFTLNIQGQSRRISLPLLARHNIANALAAAAAAFSIGLSLDEIAQGLNTVVPASGRLNSRLGLEGATIIDDSYNGNPDSVKAGVDLLVALEGTKILALGDMAELGPQARQLHGDVGAYAAQQGVDYLLSCGPLGAAASTEFTRLSGRELMAFQSREALITQLKKMVDVNTKVLIKGSLSAGMKQVVEAMTTQEHN
ncbi:MAG: UDP-N-acetylmuramoyl-tripeptide--D-alanyl-D-alanine ligase [Pseudomonadales bacterium]